MDDLLTCLDDDIRTLSERPAYGMSDARLTIAVDLTQIFISRLTAVQAALVREADGRGLVKASGAVNASTWLRDRVRISITDAHKVTALGGVLDQRDDVATAVASGAVTPEQALVIGRAVADLPGECGPDLVDQAAAALLDHAGLFEPGHLRKLGDQILAHLAPDLADAQLRRRLDREERDANRDRAFSMTPDGHGRTRLYGILDVESAATVRAALDPLMTPLRQTTAGPDLRTPAARRADALVDVCRLALRTGELPADGGQPPQLNVTIDYAALAAAVRAGRPTTGARDTSSTGSADTGAVVGVGALSAVGAVGVSAAGGAGVAGGVGAVGVGAVGVGAVGVGAVGVGAVGAGAVGAGAVGAGAVGVSAVGTVGGTNAGVGRLDTGEQLSAGVIRRLACDARILPIVLGGASIPIDVGRARRLYTGAARTAVLVRDLGCAFPSCDRPPKWCDIHHVQSWIDSGPTDRDNGVALCGHHHRLIHHDAWTVTIDPDDHLPTFIPPVHIDPDQKPQRNPYHPRT